MREKKFKKFKWNLQGFMNSIHEISIAFQKFTNNLKIRIWAYLAIKMQRIRGFAFPVYYPPFKID